jgi:hypothetical protein
MQRLGITSALVWLTASAALFGGSAHAATILNGSFESPIIGPPNYPAAPNNYVYPNGTLGNWTWSTPSTANGSFDGSGIINASGASQWWGSLPAPTGFDGNQFAFVQGQGWFSQTFVAPFSGQFTVSWLEGSRQNMRQLNPAATYDGDQSYQVLIDSSLIGTYLTLSGQNLNRKTRRASTLMVELRTHLSFRD